MIGYWYYKITDNICFAGVENDFAFAPLDLVFE